MQDIAAMFLLGPLAKFKKCDLRHIVFKLFLIFRLSNLF